MVKRFGSSQDMDGCILNKLLGGFWEKTLKIV